jgi:hypothetical protein
VAKRLLKNAVENIMGTLGHGAMFEPNCANASDPKFPGAGNFAGNFSVVRPENLRLCPKCAKLAVEAGNGAGNPGNFALSY